MVLKINFSSFFSKSILIFFIYSTAQAEQTYTLKFATLIPPDTAWVNSIHKWSDELKAKSNNRLQLRIYAGGIMGDEPDVLRKIRSRQLHGGFFTGYGIGRIYPPARVLEMPFLFQNTNESDYVRSQMMPDIEQGFRNKGFELVGWPEVGFLHFFSKNPINSLNDLRASRLWLWQGDPMGEALASAADVSPVPLSIMDVYTQLSAQHGSIDTVYNSPFGALAMQWHTKLKYATNVPMTNAIGGLLISHKFYKKLPPDLQILLTESGKKISNEINLEARRDNKKSIELLKLSGITFGWDWSEHEQLKMLEIRNKAADTLNKSGYIPEKNFTQVKKLLAQYKQHSSPK